MKTDAQFPPVVARDHGGGLDAAVARYGGTRADWIDLSTGINPVPYPLPDFTTSDWTALPDSAARFALIDAARRFWQVPAGAQIVAASGASALIARMPDLATGTRVQITAPTYNEHAAAFRARRWSVIESGQADARVLVHPNNPDGRIWAAPDLTAPLSIIDESFCDVMPDRSLIAQSVNPGVIVLKSFGKFWGLAGARLGFAIGAPDLIDTLTESLGPWPVAGPTLRLGHAALTDHNWADATRARLAVDADCLDTLMTRRGATLAGGTSLFRLYSVPDAAAWQDRLAQAHIWSRIFPYSDTLLRLGLPAPDHWPRLEAAV
jgi:cobalamin biosynthetic protein CobC